MTGNTPCLDPPRVLGGSAPTSAAILVRRSRYSTFGHEQTISPVVRPAARVSAEPVAASPETQRLSRQSPRGSTRSVTHQRARRFRKGTAPMEARVGHASDTLSRSIARAAPRRSRSCRVACPLDRTLTPPSVLRTHVPPSVLPHASTVIDRLPGDFAGWCPNWTHPATGVTSADRGEKSRLTRRHRRGLGVWRGDHQRRAISGPPRVLPRSLPYARVGLSE